MDKIIAKSKSIHDVSTKYFGYANKKTYSKIKIFITNNNIDISHFSNNKLNDKRVFYKKIIKICPICNNNFETKLGHPREKTVCSNSCANTYFRSGSSHPNHKKDDDLSGEIKYRIICFRHHEKKCVCCNEKNIVEVHHCDGNKNNNKPENLIPLCSTHHKYWHSKFRYLIKTKIDKYIKKFKLKKIE
jgi:hypothetical protein